MSRAKDITGQRFGHLTATKPLGSNKRGTKIWLMQCDCGAYEERLGTNMRRAQIAEPEAKPRCKECFRKMASAHARAQSQMLCDKLGRYYMAYGTLYTPESTEMVCADVQAELETTFGPPVDRPWPLRIDPTWKEFAHERYGAVE